MNRIAKSFTLFFVFVITFLSLPIHSFAQEKEVKFKGRITDIQREACPDDLGEGECYFAEIELLEGESAGSIVDVTMRIDDDPKLDYINYETGQEVYVVETQIADETNYYIKEPIRKTPLFTLLILFVLAAVAIGGLQGLSSLIGLGISFGIIFVLVIPLMLNGTNPVLVSVFGGSLILTTAVYLSHGFNKKTSIALIGTIAALIITAVLASFYTVFVKLTGYSSDEATFLIQLIDTELNMRGILLASLILGGIGVLDDVTVGQSAIVFELNEANPSFSFKELFFRSMKIGRDHIASMINTLVLAYTASALPLVMLFIASHASLSEILNTEFIAEEIVRTLVGSIGLIASVPITTALACYAVGKRTSQTTPAQTRMARVRNL